MQQALSQFRANLDRVRSLHQLYISLSTSVTAAVDLSDMLRSEVVLLVSALDHFVHEIVREGMLEIWRGARQSTPAFEKFSVPLSITRFLLANPGVDGPLVAEIRAAHSWKTYQRPDSIADAIRQFSVIELWNQVGQDLGVRPRDLKSQVELLIDRRNKIAHEADIDPSFPGQRWAIDRALVEDATDFVQKVGESIHKVIQ